MHARIAIGESNRGRIATGLRVDAPGEPCREYRISPLRNAEYFEHGSDAYAFRVSRSAQRPILFGRSAGLDGENPADDRGNLGLLGGRVGPISVASSAFLVARRRCYSALRASRDAAFLNV